MRQLLRSVIDYTDASATSEALVANYKRLSTAKLEWVQPEDKKIYEVIQSFYQTAFEPPTIHTIKDYFIRSDDGETLARLDDLATANLFTYKNFEHQVKQAVDDQVRQKLLLISKDAGDIVSKGLIIGKGQDRKTLRGPKDAFEYFTSNAMPLLESDSSAQTQGDLRDDAATAFSDYQERKRNKILRLGKYTGINHIDSKFRGTKKGELHVHAAFTGELKSTFALNWAYNLVTRFRSNVLYVSMEMPYYQVKQIIYTIHSGNPKWGRKPLSYEQIDNGELSEEDELFYQQVLEDFETNPEYCRFRLWQAAKPKVSQIRAYAELLHQELDVGMIFLDHGGLVGTSGKYREMLHALNEIIEDSKQMALHFNSGEGVPVCLLYQINRTGKSEADKAGGVYRISAIANANEVEKSADYITTTYLNDEFRSNMTTLFGCLKTRNCPPFDPFMATVDFECRRVYNYDETVSKGSNMSAEDADDILSAMRDL